MADLAIWSMLNRESAATTRVSVATSSRLKAQQMRVPKTFEMHNSGTFSKYPSLKLWTLQKALEHVSYVIRENTFNRPKPESPIKKDVACRRVDSTNRCNAARNATKSALHDDA